MPISTPSGVDRLECLEVVYPFPVPITFASAALGTVERATILGHDVDVHLPRLDGARTAVRRPPYLDERIEDEPQYWDGSGEQEDEPDSPWGFIARLGKASSASHDVSVKRILLRFDQMTSSAAESLLEALAEGLPAWFGVLRDNCEVMTQQDLDVLSPRRRIEVSGSGWRARWGYDDLPIPQRIWLDLHDGTAIAPNYWREILKRAGHGTRPLPEALLIRDARAAMPGSSFDGLSLTPQQVLRCS